MPGRMYIPTEVVASISQHVSKAVRNAEQGYKFFREEEDAVTGALGERLRTTKPRLVTVAGGDPPGVWRWTIAYSKLRSRPKNAPESVVGADGVLEIEVGGPQSKERKVALFQAKNATRSDNLDEQCAKMSNWREAAFVLQYASNGYFAYSLDACLEPGRTLNSARHGTPLARWIIDTFIGCKVGHLELFYDIDQQRLYWVPIRAERRPVEQRWVWMDFKPKHLIRVEVRPPHWSSVYGVQIQPSELLDNRLTFDERDMLGLDSTFTRDHLTQRVRAMRRTFHPDRHNHLSDDAKRFLSARFGEVTAAGELLGHEAIAQTENSSAATKPPASPLTEGHRRVEEDRQLLRRQRDLASRRRRRKEDA